MYLVNKRIRELSDLNIFINASSENRFLRRLKRDQEERGRTFEYVVNQYVNVVAPAYEEIIAPTKMFADLIVSNDGIENKSLEILASIFKMMSSVDVLLHLHVFTEETTWPVKQIKNVSDGRFYVKKKAPSSN